MAAPVQWDLLPHALADPVHKPSSKGTFISPVSIRAALALALSAATVGSEAHSQLLKFLAAPGSNTGDEHGVACCLADEQRQLRQASCAAAEVLIANSVWTKADVQLQKGYAESVESLYGAMASVAESAKVVNEWCAKATRGLIPHPLDENLRFDALLVNALYFKGKWKHQFTKADTAAADFKAAHGNSVQVNMMSGTFKHCLEVASTRGAGGYTAVRLPYLEGGFSAVALLPLENVTVSEAVQSYNTTPPRWHRSPELRLKLPKFHIESNMSLLGLLAAAGVPSLTAGLAFGRLADSPMRLDDVKHVVVVDVDEEGTEAAAVTAAVMMRAMLMHQELVFDRPFVFAVEHELVAAPLFLGVVQDPSV